MFATLPKTPFPAIPSQQSRTKWEEVEEKQRNLIENEKYMEPEKLVQSGKGSRGSKKRGTMGGDKEMPAITSLYTPFNHIPTMAHMYKHTHWHQPLSLYLTGVGVRIWDSMEEHLVHTLWSHTHIHRRCSTSISGSSGSLVPL